MLGNSRSVESNQTAIHDDLEKIVNRHLASSFLKPISDHTQTAFEQVEDFINQRGRGVILDSCCGVGDSSRNLARRYPEHTIIGVDKSDFRISKNRTEHYDNLLLVRADLNDFYRLLAQSDIEIEQHKIFFPNPWPKSSHIKRRWHGAPVFPALVKSCPNIEMRSNWLIYLQEFQFALKILAIDSDIHVLTVTEPMTPFEAKYSASGQTIYQLLTT